MQRKIKLTLWFVYEWGKPTWQKPHREILRSLLPRIHYYHNKAVTSKWISVSYTNPQLNLYPNIQLDLFCYDNLSFSMHGSLYLTNQLMHGSKYVTNHQLEKDVGCKVLQFIHTMKIMKLLSYRTLRHTNAAASSRERWTRATLSPITVYLQQQLQQPHDGP